MSMPPGTTEFMRIVCRKEARHVATYLKQHPEVNVNAPEASGITALCVSASSGNLDTVSVLLTHRADPNVRCAAMNGATPLYAAADAQAITVDDSQGMNYTGLEPHDHLERELRQFEKVVRLLLGAGADPCLGPDSGTSPLWIAAQNGNTKVLELLLKDGRDDPNRERRGGGTPIHSAARNGHCDAVALLLADPRVSLGKPPVGLPPLWVALENDFGDIASQLLAASAEGCAKLKADNDPSIRFFEGRTLLHTVCINGLHGFRPPWKGPAIAGNSLCVLLAHLHERGGDRSRWLEEVDTINATPLGLALACGHEAIAACLLAIGADSRHQSIRSALVAYAEHSKTRPGALGHGHGRAGQSLPLGLMTFETLMTDTFGLNETDEDDVTAQDPGRSSVPERTELSALVDSANALCGYCTAGSSHGRPLKRCGGCGLVSYCDAQCAKLHWGAKDGRGGHKAQCTRLRGILGTLPAALRRREPGGAAAGASLQQEQHEGPIGGGHGPPSGFTGPAGLGSASSSVEPAGGEQRSGAAEQGVLGGSHSPSSPSESARDLHVLLGGQGSQFARVDSAVSRMKLADGPKAMLALTRPFAASPGDSSPPTRSGSVAMMVIGDVALSASRQSEEHGQYMCIVEEQAVADALEVAVTGAVGAHLSHLESELRFDPSTAVQEIEDEWMREGNGQPRAAAAGSRAFSADSSDAVLAAEGTLSGRRTALIRRYADGALPSEAFHLAYAQLALDCLARVRVAPLVDEHVALHGLQSKPELNGLRAEVDAYVASKGRYMVRLLSDGSQMLAKPENMTPSWAEDDDDNDDDDDDDDDDDGASGDDNQDEEEHMDWLLETLVREATLSDAEADAITDRMASAEASRRNLIGELESRMRCATAARTNAARDSYLVQMTLAQLSISRARYALRGAVGGRYTRQLVERVAQVLEGGLLWRQGLRKNPKKSKKGPFPSLSA